MLTTTARGLIAILLLVSLSSVGFAQDEQSQPPEKALRYLTILEKRPVTGYIFDRFYNEWLITSSVSELEDFLVERAKDGNANQRLLVGFFYAHEGRHLDAIKVYRDVLKDEPGNAATWYHKATIEARLLDFDTAVADLAKALEAKPDEDLRIKISKLRGRLLVRNGKREEARKVWNDLIKQVPNDDGLIEDLIELQIDEGLFEDAIALSEQLVEKTKDPYEKVRRKLRQGDIYQRAGKKGKSLDIYKSTLNEVSADNWTEREILLQIEQVFRQENDLQGLDTFLAELEEEHAQRIAIPKRRAQLYADRAEPEKALEIWKDILARTPGDADHRQMYADLLARADRPADAVEQIKLLVKQRPNDIELYVQLARLHKEAEQPEQAVEATKTFLEKSDQSLTAYLRTARLLEDLDQAEDAESLFEKLIAKFPKQTEAVEAQAEFFYRQDRKEEAMAIWQSLGENATTADGVARAAQSMAARGEIDAANKLIFDRAKDFEDDPYYLTALCAIAWRGGKFEEALPYSLKLVDLSQDSQSLQKAVSQTVKIISRAKQVEPQMKLLEAEESRSVARSCLLVHLYEMQGNHEKADLTLASLNQDDLLVAAQKVELLRDRYDWAGAAAAQKRLIELPGGKRSSNLRDLVLLYKRDMQLGEAIKWVDEWKKLAPASDQPWLTEAELHATAGRTDLAIRSLRSAMLQRDEPEAIATALAQLYAMEGRHAEATRIYWRLYDQATGLMDKLAWVRRLAEIASQRGENHVLIEQLKQRQDANPRSLTPLLSLAEVYRTFGDFEGRRRALLDASRINPDDVELLLMIARIEHDQGDMKIATQTLHRAMKIDPTDRAREQLIQIYMDQARDQEAMKLLREVSDEKSFLQSVKSISISIATQLDWPRLTAFLKPHIAEKPDAYQLRYLYALALEEDMQYDEAITAFLDVLRIEDKPAAKNAANASTNPNQAYMSHYQRYYGGSIPPEAIQLMVLHSYRHRAYQYQQMFQYGGAMQTNYILPINLPDAKNFALQHLIRIGDLAEESQAEFLAEQLKLRDMPYAEIAMKMGNNNSNRLAADIIMEHTDDPAVMAVALMQQGMNANNDIPEEALKPAYNMFKSEYPMLAMMACFNAIHRASQNNSEDAWKPFAELEQLLDSMQKPSIMAMQMFSRIEHYANREEFELPESLQKKVEERMQAWFETISKQDPQLQQYLFSIMTRKFAGDGNGKSLAKLLNDEVRRYQPGSKTQNNPIQQMFGRGNLPVVMPLGYPPRVLPELPPHIGMYLLPKLSGLPQYGAQLDFNLLTDHLDQLDSPVLRAAVAIKIGKPEVAEAAIDELQKAKTPTVSGRMFIAARHVEKKQFVDAINVLNKARHLPMNTFEREAVDSAITAYAVQVEDNEENKSTLDIGRKAALRLLRTGLNTNEQQQLLQAMNSLKMTDEAKRLQQRLTAAQRAQQVTHRTTAPRVMSNEDRIQKLIQSDKREEAVKLAQRVLDQYAAGMQQPNMHVDWHRINNLKNILNAAGIVDDIVKLADPGETTSQSRRLRFAALLEMLEKNEKAIALYEAEIENSNNPIAMSRAANIYAKTGNWEKGAVLLKKLPVNTFNTIAQQMINTAGQDYQTRIYKYNDTALLLTDYLKSVEKKELIQIHWAQNLIVNWEQQANNIPHLFNTTQTVQPAYKEVVAERRKAYRQFVEVLLDYPQVAGFAFSRLHALMKQDKEDLSPLVDKAKQIILNQTPNQLQHHYYHYSNSDQPDFLTPEDFIVAWEIEKSEDASGSIEAMIAELKKKGLAAQATRMQALFDLYNCPPDEFSKTAVSYYKTTPSNQLQYQPVTMFMPIVRIWKLRELKQVNFGETVFDQIKNMQMHNSSEFYRFAELLADVHDVQGPEKANALITKMGEHYLGKGDARDKLVQSAMQAQSWSHNTPIGQVRSYQNFLQQCLQREKLVGTALRELQPFFTYGNEWSNAYHAFQQIIRRANSDDISTLTDALDSASFLGDYKTFRSYPHKEWNNCESVFESTIQSLQYSNYKEAKQKLDDWLQKKGPQTIGADCMRLYVKDRNPSPEAFGKLMVKHAQSIAKMDDETLLHFAAVLPDKTHVPDDADDSIKKLLSRIGEIQQERAKKEFKTYLASGTAAGQRVQIYQVQQTAASLLRSFAAVNDVENGSKVLKHLKNVVTQQAAMGNRYGYSYSPEMMAIERSFNQSLSTDEAIYYNQLVHAMPDALLIPPDRIMHEFRQHNTKQQQFVTSLKHLDQHVQTPTAVMWSKAFYQSVYRLNTDKEFEAMESWLAEALKEKPDSPVLREFEASFLLRQGLSKASKDADRKKAMLEKIEAHYKSVIEQSETPICLRVNSLMYVFGIIDQHSTKLAGPLAKLVIEAAKADLLYPNLENLNDLFDALANSEDAEDHELAVQMTEALIDINAKWKLANRPTFPAISTREHIMPHLYRDQPSLPMTMLELAVNIQNDKLIDRLLSSSENGLRENTGVWTYLVREGEIDRAADLIKRHWYNAKLSYPRDVDHDPKLLENMPKLLDKLDNSELEIYANAVLTSAGDPRKRDELIPARSDRMATLAKDFITKKMQNTKLLQKTLIVMATDKQSLLIVRPMIEEQTKSVGIGVLHNSGSNQNADITNLYKAKVAAAIVAGDAEALVLIRASLDAMDQGNTRHQARQIQRELLQIAHHFFNIRVKDLSLAEMAKLVDGYGAIARPTNSNSYVDYQAYEITVILHAIADRIDDMPKWHEKCGKRMLNRINMTALWNYAQRMLIKDTIDIEQRVELIARILQDKEVQAYGRRTHHSILGELVKRKLISQEEWLKYGHILCDAGPVGGLSWASLASKLTKVDEKACNEAWENAVEASKQGSDLQKNYLIARLLPAKRIEDARTVVEMISKDYKNRAKLIKDVEKAEAKAAAEAKKAAEEAAKKEAEARNKAKAAASNDKAEEDKVEAAAEAANAPVKAITEKVEAEATPEADKLEPAK